MDNYIVINGKKAELTEEQLRALGIGVKKKTVFDREKGEPYYFIHSNGDIVRDIDEEANCDTGCYNVANYCTSLEVMEQRALHETLDRLLWRFSMEHDGDKIDWNDSDSCKFFIYYNNNCACFVTDFNTIHQSHEIYFDSRDIAIQAIEEIVKPFMAEHPDFKW